MTLVVVLAAAGCGGGGGDSGGSGKTLSKVEYVSELNAICSNLKTQQQKIGEPQTAADVVANGPKLLNLLDQSIAEVKKLKAPAEIKDQANKLTSLIDQRRDLVSDLIDAAKNNDEKKAQKNAAKQDALSDQGNAIAREIGATSCAGD